MKYAAATKDHKFQSVEADSGSDAVEIFAERLARKEYGKRGRVGAIRHDSSSMDHTSSTWEIFIGYKNDGGLTGRNVWLHLSHN